MHLWQTQYLYYRLFIKVIFDILSFLKVGSQEEGRGNRVGEENTRRGKMT